MNELEIFASITRHNDMKAWLQAQQDRAVKELASGASLVVIHQAQGRYHLLEQMKTLLEKSKDLR